MQVLELGHTLVERTRQLQCFLCNRRQQIRHGRELRRSEQARSWRKLYLADLARHQQDHPQVDQLQPCRRWSQDQETHVRHCKRAHEKPRTDVGAEGPEADRQRDRIEELPQHRRPSVSATHCTGTHGDRRDPPTSSPMEEQRLNSACRSGLVATPSLTPQERCSWHCRLVHTGCVTKSNSRSLIASLRSWRPVKVASSLV